MQFRRFPVVLFFIASYKPTDADVDAAMKYGPGCRFRNARFAQAPGDPLEACDAVAGEHIPERYKAAFPLADDMSADALLRGQKVDASAPAGSPENERARAGVGNLAETVAAADKTGLRANAPETPKPPEPEKPPGSPSWT